MKRTVIGRLSLGRETVRELVQKELARVQGGVAAGCTSATKLASGCSTQGQDKCTAW